ncbi:MAG: N-acetylmuramoyl-L-alanine amidase [Saprospiraceae bacterium]|nr:N-acetylmuramoyl-L-alanine amidase [Saprospiraceae bacterium]
MFNFSLADAAVPELPESNRIRRFGEARIRIPEIHKIEAASFKPGKVIKETLIGKAGYRIKTIVIDPGHGGHDPGCLGSSSHEKNIALAVALNLADGIHRKYPDIRIIMTRDADIFVPLHERAAIANRNNADLFISIHCNFIPGKPEVKGSETYVLGLHRAEHNLEVAKRENSAILLETDYEKNYDFNPNAPESHILFSMAQSAYLEQSILLAERIEKAFAAQTGRPSRSVRQAGFMVLRNAAMPSVLIETGYLSNSKEEQYLTSPEGQMTVANAILSAFSEYKEAVEIPDFHLSAESKTQTSNSAEYTVWEQPKGSSNAKTQTGSPPVQKKESVQPVFNESPARRAAPVQVEPQPRVFGAATVYDTEITPYREAVVYENDAAAGTPVNGIQFCVQLAAARQAFDTSQPKWKNTGYLLEVVEENGTYKCIACGFSNYYQAYEGRMVLQSKGFPDAFIVAYKYGQRLPLEQAMREAGVK